MKKLRWVGRSYEDLCNFPAAARSMAGVELMTVQMGLEPNDWKPLKTVGSGVREIRLHAGKEYRVIYVAKFGESVYVLHAFEKKTQKTRKSDLDLARRRFKEVLNHRRKRS